MRPRPPFRWWMTSFILLVACEGATRPVASATIRVPEDVAGIQAAISAAQNGDTVLVAPGTYPGGLTITGKSVTIASRFILTGDPNDIAGTILDGGSSMLSVAASAGAATTVRGLTFKNGAYQLRVHAPYVKILNNIFIGGTNDQVSFESGGGLVRNCLFMNAGDDGIDVDFASHPTIEDNTIQGAGNDGIEVRLHDYTGALLEIAIRRNRITGNVEDGIQLIDYPGPSSRLIVIERNVLANNGKAGLGSMANGASVENFAGAPLEEDVRIIGNTFAGNRYGLTGGDHMLVMNNIFVGTAQIAVKRVAGTSVVSHNDFWNNGTDDSGSNMLAGANWTQDPLLDANFYLLQGSPCIDAGEAATMWDGNPVNAPPYKGDAPDLGAHEIQFPVSVRPGSRSGSLAIRAVLPNPSRSRPRLAITLPDASPAHIDVFDLAGRRILAWDLANLDPGGHEVSFPGTAALATGAYVIRLTQGGRSVTARAIVMR